MTALLRVFFLFTVLYSVNATDDVSTQRIHHEVLQSAETNNGLFGVASVAGITSRNGRISSHGGIQFYPGMDASITVTNDGNKYYYPSTKEARDKVATGSIEVYPGSVFVSSTSRSGGGHDFKPLPLTIGNKPISPPKEVFFQPFPDFFEKARNFQPIEPWFMRNLFTFNPPKPETYDAWMYPNFNQIFSIWR